MWIFSGSVNISAQQKIQLQTMDVPCLEWHISKTEIISVFFSPPESSGVCRMTTLYDPFITFDQKQHTPHSVRTAVRKLTYFVSMCVTRLSQKFPSHNVSSKKFLPPPPSLSNQVNLNKHWFWSSMKLWCREIFNFIIFVLLVCWSAFMRINIYQKYIQYNWVSNFLPVWVKSFEHYLLHPTSESV